MGYEMDMKQMMCEEFRVSGQQELFFPNRDEEDRLD